MTSKSGVVLVAQLMHFLPKVFLSPSAADSHCLLLIVFVFEIGIEAIPTKLPITFDFSYSATVLRLW